jgi:hypothetical protein
MVKAIGIYIGVIGFAAFLWVVVPSSYYFLYGSPVPQPQLGQTVPIVVNHNKTVYITPEADKIITVGNAVAIGILGVSLIGLFFCRSRERPTMPPD